MAAQAKPWPWDPRGICVMAERELSVDSILLCHWGKPKAVLKKHGGHASEDPSPYPATH